METAAQGSRSSLRCPVICSGAGEKLGDTDTVDLCTTIITEFEKHA